MSKKLKILMDTVVHYWMFCGLWSQ